jgi:hypothetical protein
MTVTTSADVWDVALSQYGGAEGIAWLLEDNPGLIDQVGIVKEGRRGHRLRQARINEVVWRRMVDYLPATGLEPAGEYDATILVDDEGNALVDDEGNTLGTWIFNLFN